MRPKLRVKTWPRNAGAERDEHALLQVETVLKDDTNWCRWFAGFCDGEGSFTMQKRERRYYVPRFKLCLRKDAKLIVEVAERFDFGWANPDFPVRALRASKAGQRYVDDKQNDWDVYHKGECAALVRLFSDSACELRSDRRFAFEIWSKFVGEANSPSPVWSRLNARALQLSEYTPDKGGSQIAQMWLRYFLTLDPPEATEDFEWRPTPTSLAHAKELANDHWHQFVGWALARIGATPIRRKQGGRELGGTKPTQAFDGRICVRETPTNTKAQIIVSVNGGESVKDVLDLRDTVERGGAIIGVLITLEEPTRPMVQVAAAAGFYERNTWQTKYPKIQLRTVEELLAGKAVERPATVAIDETFKNAPKAKGKGYEQQTFGL